MVRKRRSEGAIRLEHHSDRVVKLLHLSRD